MSIIEIRILGASDAALVESAAPDVFDDPVHPRLVVEFLSDPRHHIAAAIADGIVVGFASAVHYVHPDKSPELWINEVGVADAHRGRGIGAKLLRTLMEHGRELGCHEAWVLSEEDNAAARALYASVGGSDRKVSYFTFPLPPEKSVRN